ncbi:hypothetical protein HispidOSU_005975 [Sigmodon hispidus]
MENSACLIWLQAAVPRLNKAYSHVPRSQNETSPCFTLSHCGLQNVYSILLQDCKSAFDRTGQLEGETEEIWLKYDDRSGAATG